MVDAGVVWGSDAELAYQRAKVLARYDLTWLEEPLAPEAIGAYAELKRKNPAVAIAAGENSGTYRAAEDYLENAGLSFIQIDAGRIGGITTARRVCLEARRRGVQYVNHTFKSRLSLAAAMHVFAGIEEFEQVEYPAGGSILAQELAAGVLERNAAGEVAVTDRPGLGVTVNSGILEKYAVPVEISVGGEKVFGG